MATAPTDWPPPDCFHRFCVSDGHEFGGELSKERLTVPPFSIFTGAHGHHVALQGEVDMSDASQLQAALLKLKGDVVIDCSELTFIDSTGLHVLINVHKRLAEQADHLTVEALSGSCLRGFQGSGLD